MEAVLPRQFYRRPADQLAPDLLNKVLVVGARSGRIVEVEAYLAVADPACHAHNGRTARNQVMFGNPGALYVYFSYGVHWCANVVCGAPGEGTAVLIRALEPLDGRTEMYAARTKARRDVDLCSGPGKLCAALALGGQHNGMDLTVTASPVRIIDDGMAPPASPVRTTRIGISKAADLPLRWYVAENAHVSRRLRSASEARTVRDRATSDSSDGPRR